MKEISILFLLFMTYSFLGWCLEVGCKLIEKKKFINRGFLIGPYCPIYGYGALIMTIILIKYINDPVTLFIMIILSCSLLEYITSYALEKIFHTRWWDYSKKRFNINGRICLETMIPFGIFGMLIMYITNPFFYNIYNNLPNTILYIISVILFVIYIIDNIISFKIIKEIQNIGKEIEKKQIIKTYIWKKNFTCISQFRITKNKKKTKKKKQEKLSFNFLRKYDTFFFIMHTSAKKDSKV